MACSHPVALVLGNDLWSYTHGMECEMNELTLGAEHFQALQRWPALSELSLGHNDITLDAASRAALAGLNRLRVLCIEGRIKFVGSTTYDWIAGRESFLQGW